MYFRLLSKIELEIIERIKYSSISFKSKKSIIFTMKFQFRKNVMLNLKFMLSLILTKMMVEKPLNQQMQTI